MNSINPVNSLPPVVSGAAPLAGHAVPFFTEPIALLQRGYREHGTLFRLRLFGRDAVVLLGHEHSRFFFTETDRLLSIRPAYPFFARMFDPDFYFLGPPQEYQRQRSITLPRFQGKQLDGYVEVMEREATDLADRLGERGEFDLVRVFGPLVMRIAATAFLGGDLGGRMREGFFDEFRRFSAGMTPVLPQWLPLPSLIRSRRSRDRLRRSIAELIRQRRRTPLDPPDFLQVLAETREADGVPVDDLLLVNLVLLLTWAGHETTTGHLAWAMIDLLRNPEELAGVVDEQRALLDPDEPLDIKRVHRLARLDRALHETERLHPVAYIIMRSAAENFEYAGYRIPRGTMVLAAPAVSHRLPEVFPEPDRFRPGRFEDDPKAMGTLIGFGGSVHRCTGVHFAYLEMKVIMTVLLRQYTFELVDPDPQPVTGAKTKWPASPCRVRYHRRVPATT